MLVEQKTIQRKVTKQTPVEEFISSYIDLDDESVYQLETSTAFNVQEIKMEQISGLVNYKPMNDHRYVNKLLEAVNTKLQMEGVYICCVLTKESRKDRIFNKYNPFLAWPYYALDFAVRRVVPKLPVLKKFYFSLTKGSNRVISYPEALGRMYSCGFEVLEARQIGYHTWLAVNKVDAPKYDMFPTYGALVKLKRVGYRGNIINVYKIRTMHPYSEYLQEYVYEKHGTKDGDKAFNDFRVTEWGKYFRVFWIDELPMLINWFKGELKLVGNRPLSLQKFSTYPKELQEYRITVKPGLVPPFYADMPKTAEEFYETETRYIDQYKKAPISTDIKYFFRAMYNIFIKKARSA